MHRAQLQGKIIIAGSCLEPLHIPKRAKEGWSSGGKRLSPEVRCSTAWNTGGTPVHNDVLRQRVADLLEALQGAGCEFLEARVALGQGLREHTVAC